MKTDSIAITHALFFAIASTTACDLGKGDDADTGAGQDDDDDGGGASGSTSGAAYDDGYEATGAGPITATATGHGGDCDPSATTDPSWGDSGWATSGGDSGWATSGVDTGWAESSGPVTSAESGGTTAATTGFPDTGDTDGYTCDLPLAPGGFVYGCECEDPTCDIWYDGVAQIPAFEQYCDCLCDAKGCGGAVGGVGEAGGEEG